MRAAVLALVAGCHAASAPPATPARSGSCRARIEVLEADAFVVKSWREAARRVDGFDEDFDPASNADARKALCRMDACATAPPWFVKAKLFPFKSPESAIAPLAKGGFAVVPLGATGTGHCIDGSGDASIAYSGAMSGDVLVLDETITPLAFAEEGVCRDGGPPEHLHRAIDPRTRRQIVVQGPEPIRLTVSGRVVRVLGAGCDEVRNLDP